MLAVLLAASPAAGQVVSAAPERASVTVYRLDEGDGGARARLFGMEPTQGLAMIRETRTVELPAGRSRISFRGVAETMVPQTAALEGLPSAVIERNQDYNLLTPGALVEASVGREVQLVRTNRKTGQATVETAVVRAGAQGPVLDLDGRIEALGCSGEPERLVFDGVPPGLADKPTFSVLADAPRAGRYEVRLSYLATGLAWSANYVARVASNGRTLDLLGWVTLANNTSSSFAEAPTDVVAGTLSRDQATRPTEIRRTRLLSQCWYPAVGAAMPLAPGAVIEEVIVTASRRERGAEIEQVIARQFELGDYKLYTLPEPTTVASHQTKQVRFLAQKAVPFDRIYAFTYDIYDHAETGPEPAKVVLRLRNETRAGLGKPLPSGAVSVIEVPAGRLPVLVGQQWVKDTPVGLPLDLVLGEAADVQVIVRERADPDGDGERRTFDVEFTNAKPNPALLEYQHEAREPVRILSASRKAGERNGQPLWTVRLAPGSKSSLTYVVADE